MLLAEWIFDLVVLSSRGRLYDEDSITNRAVSAIEQCDTSPLFSEESALRFYANMGQTSSPVYRAEFEDADADDLLGHREQVESEVLEIVRTITSEIDESGPYSFAINAGEILDEAKKRGR